MTAPIAAQISTPRLTGHHAPFWFWNGPLDPKTMSRQVAMMAEQGVTGVMPHPRFGMDRRQYLEEPYWRAMDATVEEALKTGSQVLLYDEYNWPSGAAGGRTLDGHPEFLPRALDYAVRNIPEPGRATLEGFTAGEPYSGVFERIIAAFLVPADCPAQTARDSDELPGYSREKIPQPWGSVSEDGHSISGEVPEGGGRIMVFFQTRCGYPSRIHPGSDAFLGYLQPGATERFIALTHEAYAARYQDHFGTLIPAIFTDEPSTISPGPFPWCDDFADVFHERRGFSLLEALPALCDDRHPDGPAARVAYWQTVAELFDERFFGRVSTWCQDHNIALTGHIFDENIAAWPCAPHLMNFLRRFDWPGIDALKTHARAVGCKIAASVAHLDKKPHFLCEALGLADGWNANFSMLKRAYHYLGVMGVDVFVPHGFHQTVENPRVECPPSFFYQNPYWPYYHRIAALTDRLAAFNQSGAHVAPVAVFYPIESLWADGTGGRGQGGYPWQQKNRGNHHAVGTIETFNATLSTLAAGPFDCDVVDAHALCASGLDADTGAITLADEQFHCLVLPGVRTLPTRVLPIIERFVRAGGLLVLAGSVPTRVVPDAVAGEGTETFIDRLRAQSGRGQVVHIPQADEASILPILEAHLSPTIGFPEGRPPALHVMTRRTPKSTQWLLINDGHEPIFTQVLLPKDRLPETPPGKALVVTSVSVDRGATSTLEATRQEQGLAFELSLEDAEAVVITVEPLEGPAARTAAPIAGKPTTVRLLDKWTFQLLPMECRDIQTQNAWIDLPVFRFQPRSAATSPDWCEQAYDDSAWPTVAAIRDEALQPAQVALLRGVLPPGARAIGQPIPASGEYALYLNGACIDDRIGPPAPEGTLDLGKARGMHDLVALEICSESTFSGLTGPLRVQCGPVELPGLMSWANMGLWWHAGRACYRTEVIMDKAPACAILDLGQVQHYAEIWVNGRCADLSLWPPYRLDIAPCLHDGTNDIRILVSNSVANRFLWDHWSDSRTGASWGVPPQAEPSGLIGPVHLSLFQK